MTAFVNAFCDASDARATRALYRCEAVSPRGIPRREPIVTVARALSVPSWYECYHLTPNATIARRNWRLTYSLS